MSGYFKDLSDGVISTLKGMSVTLKHLFSRPVTVQYPDEKLPIADAYRGRHVLNQQGCRACSLCAKACPVECIDIETERHAKRVIEFKTFTIDYNKCLFCGLCVEACPAESLVMTKEYDLSTEDRSTLIKDLLAWHGLREEDLENIRLLEEKERAKKEKEAKEAAAAAAAGDDAKGSESGETRGKGGKEAGKDPAGETAKKAGGKGSGGGAGNAAGPAAGGDAGDAKE